ncbi:MAG TPA: DNA-3-methyladenine glycosylase [Chitinophagaceae bacterium]|nr:DNA-3-methyladenine glycosylase [Chitinophagaceae bacterium]
MPASPTDQPWGRWNKLPAGFYLRSNVVSIARDLLGKILVTNWHGVVTAGRIVETEAYRGKQDRASHAAGGRRTARNEIMYREGGNAYVYLCYGIHYLFNVVTNRPEVPHAILIRGLEPLVGEGEMRARAGKRGADSSLTRGPGNLTRALGITGDHNGLPLTGDCLYLAEDGTSYAGSEIGISARIGVEYAGPDAELPYRFFVRGNPHVSGPRHLLSQPGRRSGR